LQSQIPGSSKTGEMAGQAGLAETGLARHARRASRASLHYFATNCNQ
jgi:hypothetical protein